LAPAEMDTDCTVSTPNSDEIHSASLR
jgi:hypothetical protein